MNFLSTLENILTTIIIIMMCYLTYLLFKIQREDIEFLLQLKKKIHEQKNGIAEFLKVWKLLKT